MLIEFNELVKNETLCQEDILNDIRSGRRREKDRPEVWIPDIPLSYYKFKREQKDAKDLEMRYATTNPENSSDSEDDIPINRKIVQSCSNILKVACIIHAESKKAKKVSVEKSTTIKTKPTKRPAEPLGDVSDNVGHPKRRTKKPKKSLL